MAMQNIDIKDFQSVSSVELFDHVVVSLFSGLPAKISVGLLRRIVAEGIMPSVHADGYWYVGDENTEVKARGETPQFRKSTSGIEYKYSTEDNSSWRPLVSFHDLRLRYEDLTPAQVYELRMRFEDLTPDQQDILRLKFEDLTEEQVKDLQRPVTEAVELLKKEEELWKAAEELRVKAEEERIKNEQERVANNKAWTEAEFKRQQAESERIQHDAAVQQAEAGRTTAEAARQQAELSREEMEKLRQQWYEEASKQWGNQTLALEVDDNGDINVITGGVDTGFRQGYVADNGDVVLEFYFW